MIYSFEDSIRISRRGRTVRNTEPGDASMISVAKATALHFQQPLHLIMRAYIQIGGTQVLCKTNWPVRRRCERQHNGNVL